MIPSQLSNQIKMHSEELYQLWLNNEGDTDKDSNPQTLKQAYNQLCDVIERIEASPANQLLSDELNEIANNGIELHIESLQWAEHLRAQAIVPELKKSLISLAAWAGRHHCELEQIEVIVNILGEYCNQVREPKELEDIAYLSMDVIASVPKKIKLDRDKNNPGRPWRILLLNNAIIATRSNQDNLIEQAYQLIGQYLPEDATDFFSQALKQMDIVGYPDNVRILVRRYYELWTNKTQH
jgi:hypothetical protein